MLTTCPLPPTPVPLRLSLCAGYQASDPASLIVEWVEAPYWNQVAESTQEVTTFFAAGHCRRKRSSSPDTDIRGKDSARRDRGSRTGGIRHEKKGKPAAGWGGRLGRGVPQPATGNRVSLYRLEPEGRRPSRPDLPNGHPRERDLFRIVTPEERTPGESGCPPRVCGSPVWIPSRAAKSLA